MTIAQAAPTTPDPFLYDPDALYTKEEAALLLNVSPRTLEKWAEDEDGPARVKGSRRFIRYRRGDLEQWIEVRRVHGSYAMRCALLEAENARLRQQLEKGGAC